PECLLRATHRAQGLPASGGSAFFSSQIGGRSKSNLGDLPESGLSQRRSQDGSEEESRRSASRQRGLSDHGEPISANRRDRLSRTETDATLAHPEDGGNPPGVTHAAGSTAGRGKPPLRFGHL